MGSSCSILNDTEYDVWITERINWQVLAVSVGATAALLSGGIAAFLALGPIEIGLGSALSGMGGAVITTKFKETAAAAVHIRFKSFSTDGGTRILRVAIETSR